MKRLFVAMSLSMSIWACGGGSTTTPTAAPSPAPASPFAVVTGNYELTIEIDDKCAQIPPALRVRRYNATLEDRGWHFLPVNVVGGDSPRLYSWRICGRHLQTADGGWRGTAST